MVGKLTFCMEREIRFPSLVKRIVKKSQTGTHEFPRLMYTSDQTFYTKFYCTDFKNKHLIHRQHNTLKSRRKQNKQNSLTTTSRTVVRWHKSRSKDHNLSYALMPRTVILCHLCSWRSSVGGLLFSSW